MKSLWTAAALFYPNPSSLVLKSHRKELQQPKEANMANSSSITLTVLSGPAAGSSCTKDGSKPIRVGRVKSGNTLVVKDGAWVATRCLVCHHTSQTLRVCCSKVLTYLCCHTAASVSSKHLEFTWSDGDWFALDLGSSNGTRLNESQVPMMAGWCGCCTAVGSCHPSLRCKLLRAAHSSTRPTNASCQQSLQTSRTSCVTKTSCSWAQTRGSWSTYSRCAARSTAAQAAASRQPGSCMPNALSNASPHCLHVCAAFAPVEAVGGVHMLDWRHGGVAVWHCVVARRMQLLPLLLAMTLMRSA